MHHAATSMTQPDCLFCKIIRKEIPAAFVYEDEAVVAFLNIKPVNPGHVLVVPKHHSDALQDAEPAVLDHWIRAIQTVAKAMMRGLGVQGFNLEQNNGAVAGQVIPHLHIHIVPRYPDDGLQHWAEKTYATEEEKLAVADSIRRAF